VSTNAALSIPARQSLSLPDKSLWIMTLVLVVLAFFLIYPVLLLLVQSFNVAAEFFGVPKWGLDNWRNGFQERGLLVALANTVMVWAFSIAISLPIAIAIAWTLARTRIPFSRGLEFMFWVAFMLPSVSRQRRIDFRDDATGDAAADDAADCVGLCLEAFARFSDLRYRIASWHAD
jgi:ABC-type spermidine/putrescine transport system permease subunit I